LNDGERLVRVRLAHRPVGSGSKWLSWRSAPTGRASLVEGAPLDHAGNAAQSLRLHPVLTDALQWRRRANLKTAWAWRLGMTLRAVFGNAREHHPSESAAADPRGCILWPRRSHPGSSKRLATRLKKQVDAVVRGMLGLRSNALVEAMNGLLQQAKRAARGIRTAANVSNIAYLRLGKLTHLADSPCAAAAPRSTRRTLRAA
jgi:hypothetical protein